MTPQIATVLIIIGVMSVSFFTEILPLAFTALLVPVALQATGILTAAQAWSGFSNTTVITWIGLFIIGAMFAKTSITYQIKRFVAKYGKGSGIRILMMVILASTAMALLTSATAAIAVLAPIISEICNDTKIDEKRMFKPVADIGTWAAVLTFPIGSTFSYILMCNSYIENSGGTEAFGLFDFTLIRVPMLIVLVLYFVFVNRNIKADTSSISSVKTVENEERQTVYSPLQEKLAVFIFFANVILMVFVTFTKVMPSYLVSTFFAALAVGLKLMTEKEALSSVSWSTIFLVAGTLPLSTAISDSGTGAWLAEVVQSVFPAASNPIVLATGLCAICAVLTQFMSNSAVMSTFGPIGASMAIAFGIDPRLVVAGAMTGAIICFATPMATTAGAYAYGYCKFNMKEYIKAGIIPCILLVIVFAVWAPIALNMLYA